MGSERLEDLGNWKLGNCGVEELRSWGVGELLNWGSQESWGLVAMGGKEAGERWTPNELIN